MMEDRTSFGPGRRSLAGWPGDWVELGVVLAKTPEGVLLGRLEVPASARPNAAARGRLVRRGAWRV